LNDEKYVTTTAMRIFRHWIGKGGPIEVLVVDCGRSLAVNDAWWTIYSSRFVPDKTLIIMQDWQNHKRVSEVYLENTKIFTHSKGQ
jgi:DNA polymerase IIIc chi subunit